MLDMVMPDLTFPRVATGSHAAPWDLRILLYRGGAAIDRRRVSAMTESGALGQPLAERLSLFDKLHEVITGKLEGGGVGAVRTATWALSNLFRFVAWVDAQGLVLTLETVRESFFAWVEHLMHRYQISKDLSHTVAYVYAVSTADLVARAQDFTNSEPGRAMLRYTRMRAPKGSKRALGAQADKQNLADTFAFGHLMTDLCNGLSVDAVRGPLPVLIRTRDGRELTIKGLLHKASLDVTSIKNRAGRADAMRVRAPLSADRSAIDHRPSVVNLRIEAELLIFTAQTGMNLAQAAQLRREHYRWQTDGDELNAFRVHKGRRAGEALFRCFKAYSAHLNRYLAWLAVLGLREDDERLFPFIYHTGTIPAQHRLPTFTATVAICKEIGVAHFKPRALRKTRVNWLLRRSRDPQLTADQDAHSKETLLRVYAEPHHQSAAIEIIRFHQATDPTLAPPGDGICVDENRRPEAIAGTPPHAPEPDCISPEGCLFCIHHRDVLSGDYAWKLASHSRLKCLELVLYRPPKLQPAHPAHAVIDRIEAKLKAIAQGSEVRALWIRDAKDAIRAGRYHPLWDGRIQLLEALHESA